MLTIAYLIGVVASLVVHEYLATRARSAFGRARRVVLLVLMLAAVAFGARAQLATRFDSALAGWRVDPVAFDPSDDATIGGATNAQRPERPFPAGGSPEDVRAWQQHVTEALRGRAEFHAGAEPPVDVTVLQTEQIGNVRRTFLRFITSDGSAIPAYVHQPLNESNLGGVMVIPGHGAGIRATAGVARADYQHAAALELAKRGYVTLTAELRGFGMLTPGGVPTHRAVAHSALSAGSFYKAQIARDLQMALTVLQQWDGVDPARIAVAGTSLGAELAVFLGTLDPRPRVIISHSYGGVIGPTPVSDWVTDQARQTPHGCHIIPGVDRVLWREDWFRLLAPRAVQVVRGTQDVPAGANLAALDAAAAAAFAALGARDRFELGLEPGRHEFFIEPAVRFLAKWL